MYNMNEKGKVKSTFIITKFIDSAGAIEKLAKAGKPIEFLKKAYAENFIEEKVIHGNIFLNEGINLIWTAVCGGTFTPFDNANAHIGVGDGTTPADSSQTGLQGTNKYYKGMDDGYPIYGSNQKVVFRATFGADEANFSWNEWTVANGAGDEYINLNRKVESLGTKVQGTTWIFTVELSLS